MDGASARGRRPRQAIVPPLDLVGKPTVFPHVKCYRDGIIPSKENVTGGAMSVEDKMTIDERRKYLKKMQERYLQADRKERG
jgi:hypothetical protein